MQSTMKQVATENCNAQPICGCSIQIRHAITRTNAELLDILEQSSAKFSSKHLCLTKQSSLEDKNPSIVSALMY